MSLPLPRITYTGAPLPGAAQVVTLFDTTVAAEMASFASLVGAHRIYGTISHDQSGTVSIQKSVDRGLNWRNVDSTASAAPSTVFDYVIEGFRDFRVRWTNGGTPQTIFEPDVVLTDQRAPTT